MTERSLVGGAGGYLMAGRGAELERLRVQSL
jgi:hypothetical protein